MTTVSLFDRVYGNQKTSAAAPAAQAPARRAAFQNEQDMVNQCQAFRGQYRGTQADAQAEVARMLQSGKISPQMLQLGQMIVDRLLAARR